MNSSAPPISTRPARQTPWGRALCLLTLGVAHALTWAQDATTRQLPAPNAVALLVTQCPAAFPAPMPSLAQSAYLDKLADQAEACDTRADYFAHRGSLLLMAGRLPEAATNLEKALLLNPDLPGAQLDFAQALAQLGQKEAALQLVDQVGGRTDIEPGLRQWLSSFQTPPKGEAWSWNAMLQSSLGRETNLDSATHTDTLTLYLSNGPVIVNLTDAERPRAGTGIKNWLAVQGLRATGPGEVRRRRPCRPATHRAHPWATTTRPMLRWPMPSPLAPAWPPSSWPACVTARKTPTTTTKTAWSSNTNPLGD